MGKGARHMPLHGPARYAELLGDLVVVHLVEVVKQERLPGDFGKRFHDLSQAAHGPAPMERLVLIRFDSGHGVEVAFFLLVLRAALAMPLRVHNGGTRRREHIADRVLAQVALSFLAPELEKHLLGRFLAILPVPQAKAHELLHALGVLPEKAADDGGSRRTSAARTFEVRSGVHDQIQCLAGELQIESAKRGRMTWSDWHKRWPK